MNTGIGNTARTTNFTNYDVDFKFLGFWETLLFERFSMATALRALPFKLYSEIRSTWTVLTDRLLALCRKKNKKF